MIREILYKGEKINLNDVEIIRTDRFGDTLKGTIDEFGSDNYNEGYAEAEAGEGW